jgi:hypothetical protein
MLVESRDEGPTEVEVVMQAEKPAPAPAVADVEPMAASDEDEEETLPASPMSMQDGIKAVQQAFSQAATPPRWPMYVRQAKQFLRNSIENFDERKYGFASVVDLLRAAGKEGVLRIERDRQGAVRVFPGQNLVPKAATEESMPDVSVDESEEIDVEAEAQPVTPASEEIMPAAAPFVFSAAEETVSDAPIVDAEPLPGIETDEEPLEAGDVDGNRVDVEPTRIISRRRPVGARKTSPPRESAPRAPRTPRAATKTTRGARKTGGRR